MSSFPVSRYPTEYAVVRVTATGMVTLYHSVPRCTTPVAVAVAVNYSPARGLLAPVMTWSRWISGAAALAAFPGVSWGHGILHAFHGASLASEKACTPAPCPVASRERWKEYHRWQSPHS